MILYLVTYFIADSFCPFTEFCLPSLRTPQFIRTSLLLIRSPLINSQISTWPHSSFKVKVKSKLLNLGDSQVSDLSDRVLIKIVARIKGLMIKLNSFLRVPPLLSLQDSILNDFTFNYNFI